METTHFESLYPSDSRSPEIAKIVEYIKQGNSSQVIGLPGVGRSTVLGLLSYNKSVRLKHLGEDQQHYHFVLINFSEIRRRPLVDVTKLIFLSLVDSLKDRHFDAAYAKTYALFKESVSLNDELVLFQSLKQALDILAFEKNLSIIFLFDRFEEYIPVLTDGFFANLRVLRNRAKYKFSAVFSLSRPLEDLIEPTLMAEFYEFIAGHTVYLPLIDKPVNDFRINHLETISNKKLEPKTRAEILQLTGGLGKLTKACIEIVLNPHSHPVIPGNDKAKLDAFFLGEKNVQRTLSDVWGLLSPSEQDFLLSNIAPYTTSDVDYTYLANIGLLNDGKLTIPLFETFIKNNLKRDEQTKPDEPIIYDPNTNEIKQGTDIISDRLTSSEFRLLRFLIENAGTVVERETIINAVWKDSATTAGVTDQALDQLLFRVRKKIEDDPNTPTHIQTVKGRGIRFTH